MNLKRGILIGLALYLITFIVGIVLTVIAQINFESLQNMPTTYWIITIIVTVILTSLTSLWYFSKAERNIIEGLKLGITFAIIGFVLDLLFFIPLFLKSSGTQIILQYYSTPSFYITLALVIATTSFIGSRNNAVNAKKEMPQTRKHKKK
ncbi:hypothetical protein J4423_01600 [Candidatus Pacearchaeota archaeon]|nr:hypothetical protein [Candidatus Pacearchaeota archaeon]